MCGISGLISLESCPEGDVRVSRMVNAMHHRGPDDNGLYNDDKNTIHFGHNRLSIIDLDSRSKQPMLSSDARFVLTFNGEIYNYLELKKECEKKGSRFLTTSDSEVIIEAYRHWGEKCLAKFKGMWAFALYDKEKNTVLLARDFFGIKPLHFSLIDGKSLYFASEIKALTSGLPVAPSVDEVTVDLFLNYGYLDRGNWTFYNEIKRFPHCKYLLIDLNKNHISLDFQDYWTPFDVDYSASFKTYDDAVSMFKHLHQESIKLHCRSDVEVGSCLSGGLDSSSIVSQAVNHTNDFKTFTTQYEEYPDIDESQLAKEISNSFGAKQFFTKPSVADFKDHLDNMIRSQDEPFGSTSIFSQYMVFNEISKNNVKVVLDGQGADELMGGYLYITRYALEEYLSKGKYLTWLKEMISFSRNHGTDYWKTIKNISNRFKQEDPKNYFLQTIRYKDASSLEERLSFSPTSFNNLQQYSIFLSFEGNLQQLLRYEDRNSMNFSIESRVPFLEPDLVSFLLQLPTEYKFRNGFTKSILRSAYENVIPDKINWQKKKMGFPAPEKAILKDAYGISVDIAGSYEWRKFILEKWRR